MKILDNNGNVVHVIGANAISFDDSGICKVIAEDGARRACILPTGTIIIYDGTDYAVQPAAGLPWPTMLKQLRDPDARLDLNKVYLAEIKQHLKQFNAKQMQWAKATLNPLRTDVFVSNSKQ